MTTLFHFATPVQISPAFARGILPDPTVISPGLAKVRREIADSPTAEPKRMGYDALDQAWHCGFTAQYESEYGQVCLPPKHMSQEEAESFLEGVAWGLEQLEADMAAAFDAQCDAQCDEAYSDWVETTAGAGW